MKKIFILLFLLAFTFILTNYVRNEIQEKDESYQEHIENMEQDYASEKLTNLEQIVQLEKQVNLQKEKNKIYTMVVGGDIMMDRGVEGKIKKLAKDYSFPFEKITGYLKAADYVFANLEGSLSDVGKDQGGKYSFRFDIPVAQGLADAGIDAVSLANNHMLDWGRDSLCATTTHLKDVGINYVGAGCDVIDAEHIEYIEFGDTKIALLAYTEFHPWAKAGENRAGMSEWDVEKIQERIQNIKSEKQVDLIFVSMHWGEEYLDRAPDRIVKIGHDFIDAGVDVIIGHHPHVDQEIERYSDGWIIYSLGNLVFDQSWSTNTMEGLLVEIKVQDGRVYDIIPKPIKLNNNFQPELI